MIILVSGATAEVSKYSPDEVGRLLTPASGNSADVTAECGQLWAADNGCFKGLDPDAYLAMLNRIAAVDMSRLIFVSVPDVVGDHHVTLSMFRYWLPALKRRKLPAAFVCQDGADIASVPWADISAVFIGGYTRWKLSQQAERIIRYARARGLWVHIGRVNRQERIRHCAALGADSIDGSQFSKWSKTHLPWAVELLKQEHKYLWD